MICVIVRPTAPSRAAPALHAIHDYDSHSISEAVAANSGHRADVVHAVSAGCCGMGCTNCPLMRRVH